MTQFKHHLRTTVRSIVASLTLSMVAATSVVADTTTKGSPFDFEIQIEQQEVAPLEDLTVRVTFADTRIALHPDEVTLVVADKKVPVRLIDYKGNAALITFTMPSFNKSRLVEVEVILNNNSRSDYVFANVPEPYNLTYLLTALLLGTGVGLAVIYVEQARRKRAQKTNLISEQIAIDTRELAEATIFESIPEHKLPNAPSGLIDAMAADRVVLVLGSGMNAQSGLKTWREMIGEIANEVESADDRRYYEQEITHGRADGVAESLRSILGVKLLTEKLLAQIAPKPPNRSVYEQLQRYRFAGVINLNFDNFAAGLTPDTEQYTHRNARGVLDKLSRGEQFSLHLNGSMTNLDLLFSNQDLRDAVSANESLGELLQRLYYSNTLLFLGVSLDGVLGFFRPIERTSRASSQHFAVLEASDSSFSARSRSLQDFGVETIPFSINDRTESLPHFINSMSAAIGREDIRPQINPFIKRLELRNIGPFKHEQLEFDANWNVILGDNGVGKSTILKAITLAVCGGESARYARRLLRNDASSGEIIMYIGEKRYVTSIRATSEDDVIVEAVSGLPYKLEGILFAGFSALRNISWQRGDPGNPGAGRPQASDILPMITGERDPRLDGVKRLIMRLDHSVASSSTDPESRKRYRELYDRLYTLFNNLAEGMVIERGKVDAQSGEITVRTSDGDVPFEALSQGTLSLVSWAGALLQRLYEISPPGQDPMQAPGMVLIDEIDAHMHPAWQRTLPARLSDLFPNIQFLATSHSPLTVSGLKINQIYRLARHDDGNVFKERPDYSLKGIGAAGILNSNLFDVSSLDEATELALTEKRKLVAKVIDDSITDSERSRLAELEKQVENFDFTMSLRDQAYAKWVSHQEEMDSNSGQVEELEPEVDLSAEEQLRREQLLNESLAQILKEESDHDADRQ
ncbi:MAG: AAA family ATPase [Pseudomonadota bacterium]